MALDILSMWNFADPAATEARFRAALQGANMDETLILQTQIARTLGLRKRFDEARAMLDAIEPHLGGAGPEPRVRYWLELGRTLRSTKHALVSESAQATEGARHAFMKAHELAVAAQLDYLAIDALHMMAMVDTDPSAQLAWDQRAIAAMQASTQPDAKKWEGSLRNNLGYALALLKRHEEANEQFELSLAARKVQGKPDLIRIAYWMIAWNQRLMGRLQEALAIQLRLEQEWGQAGAPDPEVFEELAILYEALGDSAKAAHYKALDTAARQ